MKLSTEHIVCHGGHLNLYNLPGCRLWADTAAASQPPHPSKAAMEGFSCCAVFTLECNSNTFPLFSDLYKIKTGSRLPSDSIRRVCLQSSLFCGCGVFCCCYKKHVKRCQLFHFIRVHISSSCSRVVSKYLI